MTRLFIRLRGRLNYANTVATIALFAALSTGGAYAATQLGKNSIGPKQIRKGAVGSRALKNNGIGARDLSARVRGRLASTERANVANDGSLRSGTASSARRADPNTYTVTFKRSVGSCTYAATLALSGTEDPESGSATISGFGGREVTVTTFGATGNPVPAGFHLLVVC